MKTCAKCKTEKENEDFHKNKKAKDGLASYCKSCTLESSRARDKDKLNARRRERRATDPEYRERISSIKKDIYWSKPQTHLLYQARQALKRRGIECNLVMEDIIIPDRCPIFNVPFDNGRYSPSLDRKDNSLGYTKENVWVISRLANTMKNDASLEELKLFCENIIKKI